MQQVTTAHVKPFNWSAALKGSPRFTKSKRRNWGLRLEPKGTQPFTLARILQRHQVFFKSYKESVGGIHTHEATLLVVGASSGSLRKIPVPMGLEAFVKGLIFRSRMWLIKYIWSSVGRGPLILFTLHGNVGSVSLNGVSHICNSDLVVILNSAGDHIPSRIPAI